MSQMNEAQYDTLCRMAKNDNFDGMAAAFRALAEDQARAAALAVVAQPEPEPELPQVASGGGYL